MIIWNDFLYSLCGDDVFVFVCYKLYSCRICSIAFTRGLNHTGLN